MTEGYHPSPEELGLSKNESTPARSSLTEISLLESQAILDRVEIRGSGFRGQELRKQDLLTEGLGPKYKIDISGKDVWVSSSAYELGSGRDAVVAYVQKNERYITRAYYRSNSQGVWRYLPAYHENDGQINWYSKGYGEASITLPIEAQQALAELTKSQTEIKTPPEPERIFAGMSRNRDYTVSYRDEVNSMPDRLKGNFYPQKVETKIPPEQVKFQDPGQAPDFSKQLASWEQQTALYGKISVEAYGSKNDQLKFMFCRDSRGRAWIGGIEDDSPVTSTGLRQGWVDGGDLTTPAFEYHTPEANQTGGYGNDQLTEGHYSDMYENYLSKIPIIKEYQQLKGQTPEISIPTIDSAQNLGDLYRALDSRGGLQGSAEFYSSEDLKSVIELVQKGTWPIESVTRTDGLRQKVADLLGKKMQ